MSMDDVYALISAVIRGDSIQLKKIDGTLKAEVLCATISVDHSTGYFSGSVNYHVVGEKYANIEAIYNMWKYGWEPLKGD